ncbi:MULTISPECIES: YopX family protein [Paenibacillus]|uniref:Putative phage protein (TIGR01671 family) n=1 Tax=Paenibacillus pabuli TaxID=1472 RepID=A0A855XRA8_9BACL|nr:MULTISPECIES: YopX family protein [Paenibacillus]PWW37367.1 putative phage protein (TIGR01671 family) [Paenibacillus pabuli]PXW05509.1 putative phage protein (TIGR01671 family) [Paenibacillus taichungensis]
MREIKFRAWDSIQGVMLPVERINFREDTVSLNEGDNSVTDTTEMFQLMQFTGLQDRKQKDIYECDIMDYFTYVMCNERRKGIVCFDEKQSKYKIVPFEMYELNAGNGGYTGHSFDSAICANSEVIGNIYDNPELLAPKEGADKHE